MLHFALEINSTTFTPHKLYILTNLIVTTVVIYKIENQCKNLINGKFDIFILFYNRL